MELSPDGTLRYFYDDFTAGGRQLVLDGFEQPAAWQAGAGELRRGSDGWAEGGMIDSVGGHGAELVLQRRLPAVDLRRWRQRGYATCWLRTARPEAIAKVQLGLGDGRGWRWYEPLVNPPARVADTPADEPGLPNLPLLERDQGRGVWVDYRLATGWNLLLWRLDRYHDLGAPDLGAISRLRLRLSLRGEAGVVGFDELRLQDGLQRPDNPLAGRWCPPHGRPQFGVYEPVTGGLRLRNVRLSQSPSNGDHARLVSAMPLPPDFALRLDFTLTNLRADQGRNGWLRVTYDFEPRRDAGHEWFGAFLSLEHERLGLCAVWPLGPRGQVGEEPPRGSRVGKKLFRPRAGQRYRLELVARGQTASVRVSEVRGRWLVPQVTVARAFTRRRRAERYPLAIESTGSHRTVLHELEVTALRPR